MTTKIDSKEVPKTNGWIGLDPKVIKELPANVLTSIYENNYPKIDMDIIDEALTGDSKRDEKLITIKQSKVYLEKELPIRFARIPKSNHDALRTEIMNSPKIFTEPEIFYLKDKLGMNTQPKSTTPTVTHDTPKADTELIAHIQTTIKEMNLKVDPAVAIQRVQSGYRYVRCHKCGHEFWSKGVAGQCSKCMSKNQHPKHAILGIPHEDIPEDTDKVIAEMENIKEEIPKIGTQADYDKFAGRDEPIPEDKHTAVDTSTQVSGVKSPDGRGRPTKTKTDVVIEKKFIGKDRAMELSSQFARMLVRGIDQKWASITKHYERCPMLLAGKPELMVKHDISAEDIQAYISMCEFEEQCLSYVLVDIISKMEEEKAVAMVMFIVSYGMHRGDWIIQDLKGMVQKKKTTEDTTPTPQKVIPPTPPADNKQIEYYKNQINQLREQVLSMRNAMDNAPKSSPKPVHPNQHTKKLKR